MVVIRPERPVDREAIYALHTTSFPSRAEAQLVDALRARGRLSASLVAEVEGVVVGHIAFSPVTTASRAGGARLAPVAVSEAQRRRGIGAELVCAGLEACRAAGFGWVAMLGEPRCYARLGFRPASEVGLSDEYGGGLAFQVLELVRGALPVGAGQVPVRPGEPLASAATQGRSRLPAPPHSSAAGRPTCRHVDLTLDNGRPARVTDPLGPRP